MFAPVWVELKVKTKISISLIADAYVVVKGKRDNLIAAAEPSSAAVSRTDFGSRIFFIQASISAMQEALENLFNAS